MPSGASAELAYRERAMSETAVRIGYSDEIATNPLWMAKVEKVSQFLLQEIQGTGLKFPVIVVDWTLHRGFSPHYPAFEIRISDVPDDPKPVVGIFVLPAFENEEAMKRSMRLLWGQLLSRRAQRLGKELELIISGHMPEAK
jgi:hypothetical protein